MVVGRGGGAAVNSTEVLAADIGRSGLRVAIGHCHEAKVTLRSVERLSLDLSSESVADKLLSLMRPLHESSGARALGIATAGQVSKDGVVRATHGGLYDGCVHLGSWLQSELGIPVVVRNDVQLMTLAESRYGAGDNWDVVAGVGIGSGVGGGVVYSRCLAIGSGGVAGEFGHVRVSEGTAGRPCWCGGRGCLEVQVSGVAIEERHRELGGAGLIATEILRLADQESRSRALVSDVVKELATGLEILSCCINPTGFVLGGSIGVALQPFLELFRVRLRQHQYDAIHATRVETAKLGVHAQLYGAALIAQSLVA